jgi:hypothetical protein
MALPRVRVIENPQPMALHGIVDEVHIVHVMRIPTLKNFYPSLPGANFHTWSENKCGKLLGFRSPRNF